MKKEELIITPKTKVFDIIKAYPELEDILITYVPTFEKLKNPVLRKTVGKVATLQQAALIGNVNVGELVNHLREKIGQNSDEIMEDNQQYNYQKPQWFDTAKVTVNFDVREMLANGEHPVAQVMEDLKKQKEDEIYQLIAPFLPVPLIDKASSLNFTHWIEKENDELFFIYFIKNKSL
jgi:phenylalanyl-tRNA synthetase alpha subunit